MKIENKAYLQFVLAHTEDRILSLQEEIQNYFLLQSKLKEKEVLLECFDLCRKMNIGLMVDLNHLKPLSNNLYQYLKSKTKIENKINCLQQKIELLAQEPKQVDEKQLFMLSTALEQQEQKCYQYYQMNLLVSFLRKHLKKEKITFVSYIQTYFDYQKYQRRMESEEQIKSTSSSKILLDYIKTILIFKKELSTEGEQTDIEKLSHFHEWYVSYSKHYREVEQQYHACHTYQNAEVILALQNEKEMLSLEIGSKAIEVVKSFIGEKLLQEESMNQKHFFSTFSLTPSFLLKGQKLVQLEKQEVLKNYQQKISNGIHQKIESYNYYCERRDRVKEQLMGENVIAFPKTYGKNISPTISISS